MVLIRFPRLLNRSFGYGTFLGFGSRFGTWSLCFGRCGRDRARITSTDKVVLVRKELLLHVAPAGRSASSILQSEGFGKCSIVNLIGQYVSVDTRPRELTAAYLKVLSTFEIEHSVDYNLLLTGGQIKDRFGLG